MAQNASVDGATSEGNHERLAPDPYGHRKKASVAEALADEIKRRAGEEPIVSDLTYDLRSGDPDFVDKLVALTFGNMAFDAVLERQSRPDVRSSRGPLRPRASWQIRRERLNLADTIRLFQKEAVLDLLKTAYSKLSGPIENCSNSKSDSRRRPRRAALVR